MLVAIVLFAVAAVGGVVLATTRFRGRMPPMSIALVHGAVAAAGLVTLGFALRSIAFAADAKIALILFIVAALGGFALFSMHLRKKMLPIPLVLVHALVAVSGFVLLLVASIGGGR